MVQVTMPKPYIKYKIISSSRNWNICYENFIMANMKNYKSRGKQAVDVYVALTWWFVPCLPFPGLLHIYCLFTARLIIFHVWTCKILSRAVNRK
jgi:hypothetical protein